MTPKQIYSLLFLGLGDVITILSDIVSDNKNTSSERRRALQIYQQIDDMVWDFVYHTADKLEGGGRISNRVEDPVAHSLGWMNMEEHLSGDIREKLDAHIQET